MRVYCKGLKDQLSSDKSWHYYALLVASNYFKIWDLKEYLGDRFDKGYPLKCKAKGIVFYDRLINEELMDDDAAAVFNLNVKRDQELMGS